jgi:hypothetical protein
MPSSTLHSEGGIPKRAAQLVLVAVLAWAAGAFYTLQLNPEVRYFKGTDQIKRAWAQKLTHEYGAKIVLCGGSSCEFSLDGERLLQRHGLPAVNLGRGAGFGASVLVQAALPAVRPGDTLVLALEPGLLTEPLEPPALGVQVSFALGHPEWVVAPRVGQAALPWPSALLALRPGAYHVFTLVGKLLQGRPLYRYKLSDMRPSGFNQTPVRLPITGPAGHTGRLVPEAHRLLADLRDWCRTNQVRLVYSLPWSYTPPSAVPGYQQLNARFLLQIIDYMPVLRDPRLGACTVLEWFADTGYHLNAEGSAQRTDELAEQLKQGRVWTRDELAQLAQGG